MISEEACFHSQEKFSPPHGKRQGRKKVLMHDVLVACTTVGRVEPCLWLEGSVLHSGVSYASSQGNWSVFCCQCFKSDVVEGKKGKT